MILILISVFIVGAGAVSAGDDNASAMTKGLDGDALSLEENTHLNETLGQTHPELLADEGNSFSDLKNLINSSSDSTILLDRDYAIQPNETYISISRSITLDGQGHTIDAAASNRIFSVSASGVVIKNVTLTNAKSSQGAAIRWSGNDGRLENARFINCTASPEGQLTGNGGAVYWSGNGGVIDNCYFEGCSVKGGEGGSVYWYGTSGIINNTRIVNTTTYEYGDGSKNGAFAISWKGSNGRLLNTEIANPQKTGSSKRPYAVDFNENTATVSNLTITGQSEGYSVYLHSMPLEDQISGFNVNMPIYRHTPTITMDGNVFTVNTVKSGTVTYTVDGVNVKTASVDSNGEFSLENINLNENHLIKIVYNENDLYNSVTQYFDWTADGNGDSFATFSELNDLISSSTSVIDLTGDYIYSSDSDSHLREGILISKDLTVNGNGHFIDAGLNPVRIFKTSAHVVFNNITFRNSGFDGDGCAILAQSPVSIINCSFDSNGASINAGTVDLEADNSNITGCRFTNSKGPAVTVNSKNNRIQYSYFKDNGDCTISVSSGANAYVNCNVFLDSNPFSGISGDYTRNNWYGRNAVPNCLSPQSVSNYLEASLVCSVQNSELHAGIVFSESDTGNAVDLPWSRSVIYTAASQTVIADSSNGAVFNGISEGSAVNAIVDSQRLANGSGSIWYVDANAASSGSGTQSRPYKKLKNAINAAADGDTILIAPGTYRGTGDNVDLAISKELTIDRWGESGEVIFDGENGYRIFTINANVVLSSLTFKNAHTIWKGGALTISSNCIMYNCTFTGCSVDEWAGAVHVNSGQSTVVNCLFANNTSPSGGGAIGVGNARLNVIGSVFENNSAVYAGAVYGEDESSGIYIASSTFKNNTASCYGGAVGFEGKGNITDCLFISNRAVLGGGAVYMLGYDHTVINSRFINGTAAEGGAVLSLSSDLNVANSFFANNTALSFGGALRSNLGNLSVLMSDFKDNHAYYDGGAIYLHKGLGAVYETLFEGNTAGYGGGAVHSLAGNLLLTRSIMPGNLTRESNGLVETIYLNSFIDLGNYTLIVSDTSNFNGTIPSYYNTAEEGWDTPVKDQGSLGVCWDFATVAALEIAVKKATGIELDLSEGNVKNLISKFSMYGENLDPNGGRGSYEGLLYLVNSLGPVLESVDPTTAFGFSPLMSNGLVHVSNVGETSRDSYLDNDKIKEAIMKYGSVMFGICGYSPDGHTFYNGDNSPQDHEVIAVGWDDNYSRDNFYTTPPGDGAWIVKNSWGTGFGYDGYFYLSYYDTNAAFEFLNYIIFNDTVKYDRAYEYDWTFHHFWDYGSKGVWYKNKFISVKDEGITAFSTYFEESADWQAFVYVNGELKHAQNGSSMGKGYYTFNFDRIVSVTKGDEFEVVLKVNRNHYPVAGINSGYTLNLACGEGFSFYSDNGIDWHDSVVEDNEVVCLKVFTRNLNWGSLVDVTAENVTYTNPVTVRFTVENRTSVSYIITLNGETVKEEMNVEGDEIVLEGLESGNYRITISNDADYDHMGSSSSCNFTVYKAASGVTVGAVDSVVYGKNVVVYFNVTNRTSLRYTVETLSGEVIYNMTTDHEKYITIKNLNVGNYTVTIINDGDENHNASSAAANFSVLKKTPSVTITTQDVTYSNNVTFKITGDTAGTFTINILGNNLTQSRKANQTILIVLQNLPANEEGYELTATFDGGENYNTVTERAVAKVFRAGSGVTINPVGSAKYGDDVKIPFTAVNRTDITYTLTRNGQQVRTGNVTGNSIVLSGLDVGDYEITVCNRGNENYNASNATAGFTVAKSVPKITVNADNVEYPNTATVNVKSDTAGTYSVELGDDVRSVSLAADEFESVTFENLDAGNYTVTVSISESDNINATSASAEFSVTRYTPTVNVTAENVIYPDGITVNVESDVGGTYSISIDGRSETVTLNANEAKSIAFEGLKANEEGYSVTVTYDGTTNYNNISETISVRAFKAASVAQITSITDGVYNTTAPGIAASFENRTSVTFAIVKNRSAAMSGNYDDLNDALSGLGAGNYTITITNEGDENHTSSSDTADFEMRKADTMVTVSPVESTVYGNAIEISFNILNETHANYIITKDGEEVRRESVSGNTVVLSGLDAGEYTITVKNEENENYTSSEASQAFEITKATPQISLNTTNVTYQNSVIVSVKSNVSGTYTVKVGNETRNEVLTAGEMKNVEFEGLNAGRYNITVTYSKTANYNPATVNASVNVWKAGSSVKISSVTDGVYNTVQPVINVIAENETALTYNISRNGAQVKSGKDLDALLDGLAAGSYTITVTNAGSNNFNVSNATADFEVEKASTEVTVKPIVNVTYTNAITIDFNVTNATGVSYTITKQGVTIEQENINGNRIVLNGWNAGEYVVTIKNEDSENYSASNASARFTIEKAAPEITVTANNSVYPNSITVNVKSDFSATYNVKSGNYTGTIDLTAGELKNITFEKFGAGNYSVTVSIDGTENINATSASTEFSVTRYTPTVNVNAENVIYPNGITVNVESDVGGTYTVSVDWKTETVSLNANEAQSVTFEGLKANEDGYSVTVTYEGTTNYNNISKSISVMLFKAASGAKIINVTDGVYNTTAPAINAAFANNTTVTFAISKNRSGTISGNYDDLNDALSGLGAGNYTITITNEGDENHTSSNATADFEIRKADTLVRIAPINNVTYGNPVTINLNITNRTNAVYNITLKGQPIRSDQINTNKITLNNLNAGEYDVIIRDNGNENYTQSSATARFTIEKATPAITLTANNASYPNSVTVNVKSNVSGTYIVRVGNSTKNVKLTANKMQNVEFEGLNAGRYNITVTYTETANYTPATGNASVNVWKAGSDVKIKNITDGVYNTLKPIVNVIVDNETTLTYNISRNGAQVKSGKDLDALLDGLAAGNYTITITNAESNNFNASNATADFKVEKASTEVTIKPIVNVTYGNAITVNLNITKITNAIYNITLKGQPIRSGQINTNKITLNNLNAGEYVLIIKNNGNENYTQSNATAKFTVKKATPTITLTADNVSYPNNVIVNVKSNVGGKYVVKLENNIKDVNLTADEMKSIEFEGLNAGEYNITVTYSETENYAGAAENRSVNVFKANSSVKISSITDGVYNTHKPVIDVDVENKTTLTYSISKNGVQVKSGNDIDVLLAGLAAGNYTITITNGGDENHKSSNVTAGFKVEKACSEVTINPIANATYGNSITINFNIANRTNAVYNITLKGQPIRSGQINTNKITLNNLNAGEYVIIIKNNENENYTQSSATSRFTINKAAPAIELNTTDITYQDKVTVSVKSNVSGTYTVKVGNATKNVKLTANKMQNVEFEGLNAGRYNITVTYTETANYTPATGNASVNVWKAGSSIKISKVTDGVYNTLKSVIDISTENETALTYVIRKGTVQVKSGNDLDALLNGLAAGSYTITVTNAESRNFNASSATADFKVEKASTEVTVKPIASATYGNAVTVNFNIANRTNAVYSITLNGQTIRSGQINTNKITLNNLNAGEYVLIIKNNGNENYTQSSATAKFTVKKATPTITLTANSAVYPDKVTVNVKTDVSGTYVVKVGNKSKDVTLTAGKEEKVIFEGLDAGKYLVTVTFKENMNYNAVSRNASVNVSKADSGVKITSITNGVYNTKIPEIKLTVTNRTTLTFEITRNGAPISHGNYVNLNGELAGLSAGEYTLTVTNEENVNYNPSKDTGSFKIAKASTEVTINPVSDVIYGSDVTVNFNIANRTEASYILTKDGKQIKASNINSNRILLDNLDAGEYTITVKNKENENYTQSSAAAKFTVKKATPTITLTANNAVYPDKLTVNVKSDASGTYVVKVGNKSKDVTLTAGKEEKVIFEGLDAGKYLVTVTFKENMNYNAVSRNASVNVSKADSGVKITSITNGVYNTKIPEIKLTVTNRTTLTFEITRNGTPISHGNYVNLNDELAGLSAGEYTLTITNEENGNYNPSKDTGNFRIEKANSKVVIDPVSSVTYGNEVTVSFDAVNRTQVEYTLTKDGKQVRAKSIDSNRIVLNNLDAGEYTITVKNKENENYTQSSASAKFTVKKATPTITLTANSAVYPDKVTVNVKTDVSGTYVVKVGNKSKDVTLTAGKEEKVIFEGLDAGKYLVTVTFKENMNYNAVSRNASVNVSKADSGVKITSITNGVYNTKIPEIKLTVTNRTTLTFEITRNGAPISHGNYVNLNGELAGLSAGEYTLTVTNEENVNYNPSKDTGSFKVLKAGTQVTINPVTDVTYGNDVTVEFSIINKTVVTYILTKDGKEIKSSDINTDQIVLANLNAGDYIIRIINRENANYTSSESSASFTVGKSGDSYLDNISDTFSFDYGESVSIPIADDNAEAAVTDHSEAKITIENGTITVTGLNAGDYTLNITYPSDENHDSISKLVSVTVKKAKPDTTLDNISSTYETDYGKPISIPIPNDNIKAAVINHSEAKITIKNGTITVTGLNAGNYTLNITLPGDENHDSISKLVSVSIKKAKANANLDSVNDTYEIEYGKTVSIPIPNDNIKATVINHKEAKITIKNGTITVTGLDSGNYTLNITCPGDENHGSVSKLVSVNVGKAKPAVSPDDIHVSAAGNKVMVKVSSQTPTEITYLIYDSQGKLVWNASASSDEDIASPELGAGKYSVVISSAGDANHEGISKEFSVNVDSDIRLVEFNAKTDVYYLEENNVSVRVVDENNNPIRGYQVTFNVDGEAFNIKTDGNGTALIRPVLNPGTHHISVSDNLSCEVAVKHIIKAKKTTRVKKSSGKTLIQIRLIGEQIRLSKKVSFKYDGGRKIRVSFGIDAKKQNVTVEFKGKTYNVKTNKKGAGVIKLSKKTAKKLKKGKKYKAKVTYNGTRLYKNVEVKVEFNKKTYTVKTNRYGVAKFKVTKKMVKKFKKGKKVKYTVSYMDDTVKRKIRIS